MQELITAIGNLFEKLGVFRSLVLLLALPIAYGAFDKREVIITAMLSSNLALYALGVGLLLTFIGMIFGSLYKRIEEANKTRIADFTARIQSLEEKLEHCENKCREETREAHEQMKEQLDRLERALEKK